MSILRVAGAYTTQGRFFPPSVDEQLDHYAANLRLLTPYAEDAGILLAVETHCDFRGVEIAQVIEQTGSSVMRAALDTGNGFITYNDPLDDALAPYAVTTHFKDMQVDTSGGHPPWPLYGSVLGQGHVDLDTAVQLLATQSPILQYYVTLLPINRICGARRQHGQGLSVLEVYLRFGNFMVHLFMWQGKPL